MAETCARLLTDITRGYAGHILVPMTLMHPASLDIFDILRAADADVRHVILTADANVIHQRILARGEDADCWCARQTLRYVEAQRNMSCDLRLPAERNPQSLANVVIDAFKL